MQTSDSTALPRPTVVASSVLPAAARSRPEFVLALAGLLTTTAIVVLGGRLGPVGVDRPYSDWFDLLVRTHGKAPRFAVGMLLVIAVLALLGLWLLALRRARSGLLTAGRVWRLAAVWSAPLLVGPPIFSGDVYAYVAQGVLTQHGVDVYRHGATALGNVPAANAVDLMWRNVPSPYGPLQTLVEHAAVAVTGGNLLAALFVLRAVSAAATAVLGVLAGRLAGGARATALVLTVLNPLLLLHVVSSAHAEALMGALLLGSLLAARRRRWLLAVVLACLAGSVKAPAFLAAAVVIAGHIRLEQTTARRFSAAVRDTFAAAATVLCCAVLVPDGLGWIPALRAPTLAYTFYAPVSVTANLTRAVLPGLDWPTLRSTVQASAVVLMAAAVLALLVTARRRSLERTTGFALLTVALLAPVTYPWYAVWGLICLAPTAGRRLRSGLVLLSALACVLNPAGLLRVYALGVSAGAALVTGAVLTGVAIRGRRARLLPAAQPARSSAADGSSGQPRTAALAAADTSQLRNSAL